MVSKTGKARKTAVPPEVSASEGYKTSLRIRKRIEDAFGWVKITGGLVQIKLRSLEKVEAVFVFGMVAYNIVRLPKLLAVTGEVCLEGSKASSTCLPASSASRQVESKRSRLVNPLRFVRQETALL